jgi:hypothetical protein
MIRYRDSMTPEEESALLAECEWLDQCYADAGGTGLEPADEECEDPIRDGWIGKDGRP